MFKKFVTFSFLVFIALVIAITYKHKYTLVNEELSTRNKLLIAKDNEIASLNSQLDNYSKADNSSEVSKLKESNEKNKKIIMNLENEIKRLSEENKDSSNNNFNNSSANLSYLQVKFWYDGCNYEIGNQDYLYQDPYLSKEFSGDVIVVSPTIDEISLKSGQTVYAVMTNVGLIYMSYCPDLITSDSHLTAPKKSFNAKNTRQYISLKFWQGKIAKHLNTDFGQKWYSDYLLSNKIKNSASIKIISENTDYFKMSNGVDIYASLADGNKIVWMHDNPELTPIE